MNKEIIILVICTILLGLSSIDWKYSNWTQPNINQNVAHVSVLDNSNIQPTDLELFGMLSNFYISSFNSLIPSNNILSTDSDQHQYADESDVLSELTIPDTDRNVPVHQSDKRESAVGDTVIETIQFDQEEEAAEVLQSEPVVIEKEQSISTENIKTSTPVTKTTVKEEPKVTLPEKPTAPKPTVNVQNEVEEVEEVKEVIESTPQVEKTNTQSTTISPLEEIKEEAEGMLDNIKEKRKKKNKKNKKKKKK